MKTSRILALAVLAGAVLAAFVLWKSAKAPGTESTPVPPSAREAPRTPAGPVPKTPKPVEANTQKAVLVIRVIDGNGKPPRGGRLTLFHEATAHELSPESWSVDLDHEGQGMFSALEPSVYFVSAITDQAATGNLGNIRLEANQTQEFTLRVQDGWGIRGRAVLKDGSPCGRCGISVRMNGNPRDLFVSSGLSGQFQVDSLVPGTGMLEISFESPGRTVFGFHPFSLEAPGFTDLGDVVLGVHGRIAGTVQGHDGAPLVNAVVSALRRSNDEAVSAVVRTDEGGRFVIEGLGEGDLDLGVIPEDGWAIHEPVGIPVADPSQVAIRLKKRAPKATLRVRVKVEGDLGDPELLRFAVMDERGRAHTSGGGSRFDRTFRDLEFGKTYWAQVSTGMRWGRSARITLAPEGNVVDVLVDREGCSISGTIMNDKGPMAEVKVTLKHTNEELGSIVGTVVSVESRKDGSFAIAAIPPDLPAWLDVEGPSEYEIRRIEVPAGGAALGTIQLKSK